MKQIYYVIRTLLRGAWFQRYQNPLFGVGADDEHPVVCPRGFRTELLTNASKIMITCIRSSPSFSANGQTFEPQEMNCGPVAGAIQENFPKEVEAATSYCVWMSAPLYYGSVRFEANKVTADSLFFQTMGIDVF